MQEEPISRAYKRLKIAIREQRELMDETQELYHDMFVRTLHLQKDLQSVLGKLVEAMPALAEQDEGAS